MYWIVAQPSHLPLHGLLTTVTRVTGASFFFLYFNFFNFLRNLGWGAYSIFIPHLSKNSESAFNFAYLK